MEEGHVFRARQKGVTSSGAKRRLEQKEKTPELRGKGPVAVHEHMPSTADEDLRQEQRMRKEREARLGREDGQIDHGD